MPTSIGTNWQMDVKYVPKACYAGIDGKSFYQYTVIEEVSRKRFLYAHEEQSSYVTCDFIRRAIAFFRYLPNRIQTDNGAEFTHITKTDRIHPMYALCGKLGIEHKLITSMGMPHN